MCSPKRASQVYMGSDWLFYLEGETYSAILISNRLYISIVFDFISFIINALISVILDSLQSKPSQKSTAATAIHIQTDVFGCCVTSSTVFGASCHKLCHFETACQFKNSLTFKRCILKHLRSVTSSCF